MHLLPIFSKHLRNDSNPCLAVRRTCLTYPPLLTSWVSIGPFPLLEGHATGPVLRKLEGARAGVGGRRVDKMVHFSVGSCGWGGTQAALGNQGRLQGGGITAMLELQLVSAQSFSWTQGRDKRRIAQITVKKITLKVTKRCKYKVHYKKRRCAIIAGSGVCLFR